MSKARDLADSVSTGGILEDGAVSVSEISDLTVTAAELNNVAGVNSDVQTQLDLKAPLASPTFTGTVTSGDIDIVNSQNAETNLEVTNTNTGADAQVRTKYTTDGGLFTVGKTSDAHAYTGDAYVHNVDNTNIRFATNDTERMRIDSSGNLGIGNTNPTVKLDVQNTSGVIGRIQSTSGDAQLNIAVPNANDGIIAFGDASNYRASIKVNSSDAITFQTGSSLTERFRIGSSGQLGIGGATYGTTGQVLTSGGSGAAPTWADAAKGSTITATADGAISAGDAVVLQSNGTVKSVQETVTERTPLYVTFNSNGIALSPGNPDYGFGGNAHYHEDTKTVFYFWNTGGDVYMTSMIYDSNNDNWSTRQQNVFIGDGFTGKNLSSDYNPDTGYVMIAWRHSSNYVRIVGMYVYANSSNLFQYAKTSQQSYFTMSSSGGAEKVAVASSSTDNYFRIAFMDSSNNMRCATLSMSGTTNPSINSLGTGTIATNLANSEYLSIAWDSNNNRFLVAYRHANINDYGYYVYFSTSTSSAAATIHASGAWYNSGYTTYSFVEFNPQDACFVVMFDYSSGAGIKQLDVSGSSISVVGGSSSVVNIDGWHSQWWRDMRYDSSSKKIIYGRRSAGATNNFIVGRITTSGSSPTAANTESNLHTSGLGDCLGIVSMPNISKFAGISEENSGGLFIKAFESASTTSNNTDWIGFASEAISNAASGDILVVGSTDENQSGLTIGSTYYVQTDGSLATTTTDAIKAGKAIAATKLLITEGNA